jgi:hypothetical protein
MTTDGITWRSYALVEKFDEDQTRWVTSRSGLVAPAGDDFARLGVRPSEVTEKAGNLVTTAGLTRITSLITAAGGQGPTNTAARMGVGNGAGTAAVGDVDLSASSGSTNRWFNLIDATYPTTSAGVMTFKSTFASGDGNFTWNEWGIDIGTPTVTASSTVNACLLNHKTSASLGTKVSGGSWAFTVTITLA